VVRGGRYHAIPEISIRIGVCIDAGQLFGAPTDISTCAGIMQQLDFRATMFRLAFASHENDSLFLSEPLVNEASLRSLPEHPTRLRFLLPANGRPPFSK